MSIRQMLDGESALQVNHLVVRGTYLPNTVRCTNNDPFRPQNHLTSTFGIPANTYSFKCYIDMRANAYIVGSGASTLSLMFFLLTYPEGAYADENLTWQEGAEIVRQSIETDFAETYSGQEHVVFLGPPYDLSSLAWRIGARWDVQRQEDGTVVAVHPSRHWWRRLRPDDYPTHRSTLEMSLPALTQAIVAADRARRAEYGGRIGADPSLPTLVSSIDQLSQYYAAARIPGTPDPVQSPAAYACENVVAVSDSQSNRGLVQDCSALLDSKDTLRGTAALNWSSDSVITSWEGITTGDKPDQFTSEVIGNLISRVIKVELPNMNLNGSIPSSWRALFGLTHLDLSNNSLTGEIPAELGRLANLESLKLSGNSLTGCIPLALKDVANNDLSSLDLPYCRPPPPENLRVGAPGETSIPLSWDAAPNANKYRVEYWITGVVGWNPYDDAITGTSHTVDGLRCGGEYWFRVSAYGSGTVYAAEWSDWSEFVSETTGVCVSPVFDEESYSFRVSEAAGAGMPVGTVSAADPNDDALTYTITAGNDDDIFAIDEGTGAITVADSLDYETVTSYTLRVRAGDGSGNAATVDVAIDVIDVNVDYDLDDDGLIEVPSAARLNAIRWDLDGDGSSTDPAYDAAFPEARAGMGCPSDGCMGYELTADLDLDTDGSGEADAGDDYWNGGSGWDPIGDFHYNDFDATFEGNGHTVSTLFINRVYTNEIGLFGNTSAGSVIRNVGLVSVDMVGSWSSGGLVGYNRGTIANSYVSGNVTGSNRAGGLVGWNHRGTVTNSYAAGNVTGESSVGGLIGTNYRGTVTDSYWDTDATGQSTSAGGAGKTAGELVSPTANTGIYSTWDAGAWDFGTSGQYPALKADFDGTATWQEFGVQRPGLAFGHRDARGRERS